jgi:D-alanine transaminase
MNELLWINGHRMPLPAGTVSIEDRGFQFADGIYEVIAFTDQRPVLLEEHLDRFERSAAGLLLEPDITRAERRSVIESLVADSGFREAMVYGQLTRGAARRAHVFPPEGTPATELWYVRALPRQPQECYDRGASAITLPDERWLRCDIKSVSLLPNILAKEKARRAGALEAILHEADGTVTEAAASNVFCVLDGVIRTHPLTSRILPGITRIEVLAAARALGIPLREEAVRLGELRRAEEIFVTSTTMGVMPVTALDGARVGEGLPGPIARALQEHLEASRAAAV